MVAPDEETAHVVVNFARRESSSPANAAAQTFELVDVTIEGVTNRMFKNAPPTMRELFAPARGLHEPFLLYEDEQWDFDEVMKEADALGYVLVHRYGIGVGDRVGIAMRNLPEWIISFVAILSVGAISVSLNAWWTEDELEYAINDAGLSLLIADSERISRAHGLCSRAGVAMLGARLDELLPLAPGVERWRDVVIPGAPMPLVQITPETDATILYTSGTTGFPKGAVSTHRAICQSVMAFSSRAAHAPSRRTGEQRVANHSPCFILIVPLFHVTGCVRVMLTCFYERYRLVMMYNWNPERALQLIERHAVTNFVGVPTQAWDLIESPNFTQHDTSSLMMVGGGGAPAPPTLVARVEGAFPNGRPAIGYGMTETNAYGPANSGDDYVSHPTSTGRAPTIVMDCSIRDENGLDVASNVRGQIWMKSPTLFRGYWRMPAATMESLRDGWLCSGDLGRIDDDGFLYIDDRSKDMIIRAGENVYCTEVESAIYEHPSVHEAAVIGVLHERLGEEVGCVIYRKPGATLSGDELRTFVASRLASYKVPTRVAFADEPLPRNAAGKFMKTQLRQGYFA